MENLYNYFFHEVRYRGNCIYTETTLFWDLQINLCNATLTINIFLSSAITVWSNRFDAKSEKLLDSYVKIGKNVIILMLKVIPTFVFYDGIFRKKTKYSMTSKLGFMSNFSLCHKYSKTESKQCFNKCITKSDQATYKTWLIKFLEFENQIRNKILWSNILEYSSFES